jgi:hypothetical protein
MGKIPGPKLPDLNFLSKLFGKTKKQEDKSTIKSKTTPESSINNNDVTSREDEGSDMLIVRPRQKTSFMAKIFGRTLYELRFWKALFFLALLGLIIQPIGITYLSTKNTERILLLDPSGDFILSPSRNIENTTKIQDYIADLATTALLSRNPNGLDKKRLLEQVYTNNAIKQIDRMLDKDSKWFHERLVHQKPEIKTVNTLKTSRTKAYTQVKGQIFRGGYYKGQTFQQGLNFTLTLLLVKNPSFGDNLKMPMAVQKFKLTLAPLPNNKGENSV